MDKIIERINELVLIAKQRELTKEEIAERDNLRKEFIKNFKENFENELKRIKFKD
ncbi:DUF896 domain-containing protein [Spiroplasma endosymbiont of Crioceris asparagi]|uniref:DUF896 domain-containing protein n=1 Tax=Spiroplasma endosymbiont of Crioceris asparagi TaxID=3066286 RepID=UPI0030D38536